MYKIAMVSVNSCLP